jgi:Domain of unknown function (DUF6259)
MNRREFLQGSLGGSSGVLSLAAGGPRPISQWLFEAKNGQGAGTWGISNRHVEIALGKENSGGIVSLSDLATGRNWIVAQPYPLYELAMSRKGGKVVELSSLDAQSFTVDRTSAQGSQKLVLTYKGHRNLDLNVVCTVVLENDSGLSKWRISIENHTGYGTRAIRFPIVVSPARLGESDENDWFVWGSLGGQIIQSPGRTEPRKRLAGFRATGGSGPRWFPNQYPGPIAVQFQAYYDDAAGLYMATEDDGGQVKSFGIERVENGLDLSLEHNYDEKPGFSFELPYDTVLGVFRGDWYEAADIYKSWARQQHWCSRKVAERHDIPSWLKEPRPWLANISRGDYERLRGTQAIPPAEYPLGKFWPAKNAVRLMREYSSILKTPVITWITGWEMIGAPSGPVDIFPPYEGEASFKAAMQEATNDGNYPFMYVGGFRWCYKRPTVGYSNWERFEKEGKQAAALTAGHQVTRHLDPNGQSFWVSLCAGSDVTQQLCRKNFMELVNLGAVALSLDIQLGLYSPVCYSETHDHAPGYGPWMYQKALEFMRAVREATRKPNAITALGYEEPCEVWLQEADYQYHRPYWLGGVPLFDYLYSEYALRLGGDVATGFCHPEEECIKHAMVFINGIQNLVGIGHPEYDCATNRGSAALEMIRNICAAQRTYTREYVVFGEMQRPPKLDVAQVTVDVRKSRGDEEIDLPGVELPRVFHSAWRSQRGEFGYLLVNWTGAAEKARLALIDGQRGGGRKIYAVTANSKVAIPQNQIDSGVVDLTIPPRSILLIEESSVRTPETVLVGAGRK